MAAAGRRGGGPRASTLRYFSPRPFLATQLAILFRYTLGEIRLTPRRRPSSATYAPPASPPASSLFFSSRFVIPFLPSTPAPLSLGHRSRHISVDSVCQHRGAFVGAIPIATSASRGTPGPRFHAEMHLRPSQGSISRTELLSTGMLSETALYPRESRYLQSKLKPTPASGSHRSSLPRCRKCREP